MALVFRILLCCPTEDRVGHYKSEPKLRYSLHRAHESLHLRGTGFTVNPMMLCLDSQKVLRLIRTGIRKCNQIDAAVSFICPPDELCAEPHGFEAIGK